MPYEICWESRCAHRRFHGVVTGLEIVQSLRAICGDARFDELRGTIGDYRDVEAVEVSDEEAAMISALQYGASRSNEQLLVTVVTADATIADAVRASIGRFAAPVAVGFYASLEDARRAIAARRHLVATG